MGDEGEGEGEAETQDFGEFLAEIKNTPVGPFKPFVYYNKVGDILEAFTENEEGYVEWLSPQICIRKAFKDDRVIGFQIWDAKLIIEGKAK